MSRPLTRAMRAHVDRAQREAERTTLMGVVKAVDPFIVDVEDGRFMLHDDELSLSQWMKRYHREDGVDEGDTLIIHKRKSGGEIHWLVVDCLADKDPT